MKSILILDDERVLREAFVAFFEDRLWKSIQAESAEEALKLLASEAPDAVLVDIRLPGMDGDDFIRQACALDSKIGFVICTGSPEYLLPPDLAACDQVSTEIFRKPVARITDLEDEIIRIIHHLEQ